MPEFLRTRRKAPRPHLVLLRTRMRRRVGRRTRRPMTSADDRNPFIVATCSASKQRDAPAYPARRAAELTRLRTARNRRTNRRLMRHAGRRGAKRPGRPIRVSQTRLDLKVSRQACTPGIRETATPTSGKPLYTTMSATRRASARRSDDTEAAGSGNRSSVDGDKHTDSRGAARLIPRCFGRSHRLAQSRTKMLLVSD
jgi:hypothetical protein